MARFTRTQKILRMQSAAAAQDPEAIAIMTEADLRSRAKDLERAEEAKAAGSEEMAKLWTSFARRVEKRIRKRADRIILERRHALELAESSP